jgi:hypothetical protein
VAFYEVSRTDEVQAGEYEALIVRASGKVQAVNAVTGKGTDFNGYIGFAHDGSNAHVRKLDDGRGVANGVLLASYIA